MKWINDDILLIVLLSFGLPVLIIIFTTGMSIGNNPVLLTFFAVVAISLLTLVIIRRKRKHNRKV